MQVGFLFLIEELFKQSGAESTRQFSLYACFFARPALTL